MEWQKCLQDYKKSKRTYSADTSLSNKSNPVETKQSSVQKKVYIRFSHKYQKVFVFIDYESYYQS
jgi:hypothetical protein